MIVIRVVRDKSGFIREFNVRGHAGFGKYGNDIVCAAVSAVAYTAVGALEEIAGTGSYSEQDGYMKCVVPHDIPQSSMHVAGIILETAVIGFKQIEQSYRKNVSVMDEEV